MPGQFDENILLSLRRITHAIDQYSRSLAMRFNLTVPQLVCLRRLVEEGSGTSSALARKVSLSQATVTGILDRLESHGLVARERDCSDRRRVILTPTSEGRSLVARAPTPLQERFAEKLSGLPVVEQAHIDDVLRQIVVMMEAEDLKVFPVLAAGHVEIGSEEVQNFLREQKKPSVRK